MIKSVPIQEAATLLGVSESTLRRRLRAGQVAARQVSTPQGFKWLVDVDIADKVSDQVNDQVGDQVQGGKDDIIRILAQQVDDQRQQIRELHVLLGQAQAALPAPPAQHRGWLAKLFRS